jgi:hypothetical protein
LSTENAAATTCFFPRQHLPFLLCFFAPGHNWKRPNQQRSQASPVMNIPVYICSGNGFSICGYFPGLLICINLYVSEKPKINILLVSRLKNVSVV